jgi:hypothetical protein
MRKKLGVLAAHKLNGRQIGNIVGAARQLAKFKGEDPGYVHFDPAIRTELEFSNHIERSHMHGNTLREEQKEEGERVEKKLEEQTNSVSG